MKLEAGETEAMQRDAGVHSIPWNASKLKCYILRNKAIGANLALMKTNLNNKENTNILLSNRNVLWGRW